MSSPFVISAIAVLALSLTSAVKAQDEAVKVETISTIDRIYDAKLKVIELNIKEAETRLDQAEVAGIKLAEIGLARAKAEKELFIVKWEKRQAIEKSRDSKHALLKLDLVEAELNYSEAKRIYELTSKLKNRGGTGAAELSSALYKMKKADIAVTRASTKIENNLAEFELSLFGL